MILVITPSQRGADCASALREAIGEPSEVAANLSQAVQLLRSHEFLAVVIDQHVLDAEPDEIETLLQHLGMSVPVHVNFAIAGIERVVREVRAALQRRSRELIVARQDAQQTLRNELKGAVTAILLSCEVALSVPNLSPAAENKLRTIDEHATVMKEKLGMAVEAFAS